MTEDHEGHIWVSCTNMIDSVISHQVIRFDPANENKTEYRFYKSNSKEPFSENIYHMDIFKSHPGYLFINHDIFDNRL